MNRWTWALLFASACVYNPPPAGTQDDDDMDDPGPGPGPGPGPEPVNCMEPGTSLCIELEHGLPDGEDLDTALDSSGNGFHAEANLVSGARRVLQPIVDDDGAGEFLGASWLSLPSAFAVTGSVTVELWAKHGQSLVSTNSLFDANGRRFYIGRNSDNQIECGINGGGSSELRTDSNRTITDTNWHHIACVFDVELQDIKIYIDGAVEDCNQLDAAIDGRNGSSLIGFGFVGLLDSVHVYTHALSSGDICKNAGKSSCVNTCPSGGSGPPTGGFGGFGG